MSAWGSVHIDAVFGGRKVCAQERACVKMRGELYIAKCFSFVRSCQGKSFQMAAYNVPAVHLPQRRDIISNRSLVAQATTT